MIPKENIEKQHVLAAIGTHFLQSLGLNDY